MENPANNIPVLVSLLSASGRFVSICCYCSVSVISMKVLLLSDVKYALNINPVLCQPYPFILHCVLINANGDDL
jgi:hypothetical protein